MTAAWRYFLLRNVLISKDSYSGKSLDIVAYADSLWREVSYRFEDRCIAIQRKQLLSAKVYLAALPAALLGNTLLCACSLRPVNAHLA